VREVAVVRNTSGLGGGAFTARLQPLPLKASQRVRLTRLWPKGIYKEDSGQLVLPLPRGADPAAELVDLLRQLIPVEAAAVAAGGVR
jgi:hypothetical protein